MPNIRVGMSGWTFEDWRGDFYPKGLAQKKELEYASRQVTSIEINGTFYSLQKPGTFQKWYAETPDDFCFALKAPQYITHVRRLKEVEEPLANFFASGIFCLKQKLGPILWQFPPSVVLKDDRFEKFMAMLPMDKKSALKMAKKHSSKMDGRAFLDIEGDMQFRHAFEFRHPSFMNPDFIAQMRRYGVAVVFAHSGEKSPYMEDLTANFVYARMHGQEKKYKKGYTDDTLKWWLERMNAWSKGKQADDPQCVSSEKPAGDPRDIFVYFDTEEKIYAPHDALRLLELLKK